MQVIANSLRSSELTEGRSGVEEKKVDRKPYLERMLTHRTCLLLSHCCFSFFQVKNKAFFASKAHLIIYIDRVHWTYQFPFIGGLGPRLVRELPPHERVFISSTGRV